LDQTKPSVIKNKKPKDPKRGIQAISGATISSKAVMDIMYDQVNTVRELFKHYNSM